MMKIFSAGFLVVFNDEDITAIVFAFAGWL